MSSLAPDHDVGASSLDTLRTRWMAAKNAFPFSLPHAAASAPVCSAPTSSGSSSSAVPAFPFALAPNLVTTCTTPALPPAVKKRKLEQAVTSAEWLARLDVSQAEADRIVSFEQGTPEWLASRVGRLTASNFGAAAGMNKYTSPRALLKQMLWGEFKGNAATRYGSAHEDTARQEYVDVKTKEGVQLRVEETGLVINPARPWMGNSPDGIIHVTHADGTVERGLLEIKCPFRQQFYTPDPVPSYYFAQIQGTMGNLSLPWCDFVVWTPTAIQVTRVPFDASFWETKLLPALTTFYFDMYVPLAVAKENGLLEEGQTAVTIHLNV